MTAVGAYAANPEYFRNWQRNFRATPKGKAVIRRMNLKRSHGMTPEQYDEMLAAQGGVCASCLMPETVVSNGTLNSLPVDHDHATGQRRGLLCHRCNRALGLLQDDPLVIEQLLAYRRRYP